MSNVIPQGYTLYKGAWCHPSRVPLGALRRDDTPTNREKFSKCAVKRIRQDSRPLMNKLEAEWAAVLDERYGQFGFPVLPQAIRFMLGNGIWYKPDFVVFGETGMMAFECKGPHTHRGGFENLKVAAHKYGQRIVWMLVWKDNGEWREQRILP